MKASFLFLILCTIVLSGCKQKQEKKNREKPFPIILFLENFENEKFVEINGKHISFFQYNFIGKEEDTISIQNSLSFFAIPPPPASNSNLNFILNKSDSSKIFFHKYHFENLSNAMFYDTLRNLSITINLSKPIKNSFPVLIKNTSRDTFCLRSDYKLPLIMQAKDKIGEWKTIQVPTDLRCGSRSGYIKLPPKEVIVTLVPVYSGEFKTLTRIKVGGNYSKPYWSYIKNEWFNNPQSNFSL